MKVEREEEDEEEVEVENKGRVRLEKEEKEEMMEEEKQLVDFDSARRRFLSESAGAAGETKNTTLSLLMNDEFARTRC